MSEISRTAPESCKMVFACIDAIFVEGGENAQWCMLLSPESQLSWSDIGF